VWVNGRPMRSRLLAQGAADVQCDGDSNNRAAISRKRIHRAATTGINSSNRKKDIPLGACNLRVVTGHRAGLGLCLAVEAKKCRSGSQARSSPSVSLSQARVLAGNLNRRNTCCGTLGGVAAVDKLGMMCCVSGKGMDGFAPRSPFPPLASAEPASP
jgi:hypothetical protein